MPLLERLALLAALACGTSHPAPTSGGLEVVDEQGLRDLLHETSDKTRVINFWAMWCDPCVAEIPGLARFAAAHPETELVLVNVDLPTQRGRIARFAAEHGATAARLVAFDSRDPVGALSNVVPQWPDAIPVTWVVRPDGSLIARYSRAVEPEELEAVLSRH